LDREINLSINERVKLKMLAHRCDTISNLFLEFSVIETLSTM